MKATRPRNGCARCVWWAHTLDSDTGVCRIDGTEKYYRFPPCCEYELDAMVPDIIEVTDEVHNDY